MLTKQRHEKILNLLAHTGSITLPELKDALQTSESTIRRDLNILHQQGRLVKVFGGAVSTANDSSDPTDIQVLQREIQNRAEKQFVARYATTLIQDNDFVFIDAGTTTGCMLDFALNPRASYVTNAPSHAQRMARMGLDVILIGGRVKPSTEATIGAVACDQLRSFNFSIAFLGTNGVSIHAALSTPDPDEALVKRLVVQRTQNSYVICDHSKLHRVSPSTFAALEDVIILTDSVNSEVFKNIPNVVDLSKETE